MNPKENPIAMAVFATVMIWCFASSDSAGPAQNMSNKERHELK